MENNPSKQQSRGCIVSADEIQLDESWLQDYNDAMQALNYNEELIQQRQEERKMPYEQKDNSLNLFVNKFKKDGTKEPDFTGDALVDGREWKASAWKNKDKNGNTYLGISFRSPQDSAKRFPQAQKASGSDPFEMD